MRFKQCLLRSNLLTPLGPAQLCLCLSCPPGALISPKANSRMASAVTTTRPSITLPSFASFSSASGSLYSMAGPTASINAPRSASSSSAAAAAMALSDLSSPRHHQGQGSTTPVFIPPLTPRGSNTPSQLSGHHSPNKLLPGSPVILDGRGLRSSRPDSPEDVNRKRTASAAGIEGNRRPSLNHGPSSSSYSGYRNAPSGSDR